MARKGITYDQVANAAAAIKARGNEPTIAAIRVEVGGEGSYTTISTHLARWRVEEMDRVDTRDLPPEVETAMSAAITSVWNVACKSAASDLAAIKQDHADSMAKYKGEIEAANKEIASLEEKYTKAIEGATHYNGLAANLDKKLTAATSELEATKALYKQLLDSLKPQAATDKKGADTKPARHKAPADAPENKPGETH